MAAGHLTDAFETWQREMNNPRVTMHHPSGNHRIKLGRDEILYFYEARDWVFAIFKTLSEAEIAHLRRSLSQPGSIRETVKYWRCRVHNRADVDAVLRLLERRVADGAW